MKWLADGTLGYLPAGCTPHLSSFVYFEHFCCRLQDIPLNKHWAGPFRCLSAFFEALCQVLRLLLRWSRPSWLAWLGVHTAQWRFDSTFIPAHYPVDYSLLYSGPVRIITMMRPRTLQPSPLASYYFFSNIIQVPEMGMGLGCVLRLPRVQRDSTVRWTLKSCSLLLSSSSLVVDDDALDICRMNASTAICLSLTGWGGPSCNYAPPALPFKAH